MLNQEQHTRAMLPDDDEPEPLIKPYPGEAVKLETLKSAPMLLLAASPAPIASTRSKLPLLISVLALVLIAAVGAGFWWGGYAAIQTRSAATPISTQPVEQQSSPANEPGLFRSHYVTSIGDGPLSHVTYSDGLAPFTDEFVDVKHPAIDRIRSIDHSDGCASSDYSTDKLWFVTSAPATITINQQTIAQINQPTTAVGYIMNVSVKQGDRVCINNGSAGMPPRIYYVFFGPDMYYHYDSYCYRGNCTIQQELNDVSR